MAEWVLVRVRPRVGRSPGDSVPFSVKREYVAAPSGPDLDISSTESEGHGPAVRFRVRVKTRASRNRVLGVRAGELEVQVSAPPVDGAANAELVKILAQQLDVAKSAITIVAGVAGRSKLLRVGGLTKVQCLERLGRLK